jgi:hypothetical protein
MMKPTFLVVGGARCGTTALVEGLRRHPRVFVTEPKEPHYFALHRIGANFTAPGDAHTINQVAVTDRDAYLSLYRSAASADPPYLALGEGSVSTMYFHDEAIPEILNVNPSMRLVVLLREPVERAFSAYRYMRARGLEVEEDFLTAVGLEEQRREAGWHHIWHYTAMSRYAESVAALQRSFPPERLGIFFYDDLARDYEGTLGGVLDFLGVPRFATETQDVPRVNVSGQPRFAPVHRGIAWATAQPRVRSTVKRVTSYRLREAVRRTILKREDVPHEAKSILGPRFTDDLDELRSLVPGPVPAWLEAR